MVHCYATENDGIIITNCADKKAYFILINGDLNDVWCGMDLNEMNGLSSPVYDDDIIQVYETIGECESDDYDEIVAWTDGLIGELNYADNPEDWLDENCILLGSITVPDPIGFDTDPTVEPTVTWTINNKTVKSLTINNKEIQTIVRVSDNKVLYEKPTNILAFGQSTYTASNGACTIHCTLTLNCSVASGKTVTLTGTDGSDYSATTDSNGVATFVLIGEGNITYTASFNNLSDSCLVNGMDNKIQIMKPTCSKSTKTMSNYRVQILTWTVKDENDDVVPNASGNFTYTYKSSSSSSTYYRSRTATTDKNGVATYEYICSGTGGTCYPSISCAVNGDSSHRPSVTGNWKYKSYTYP